MENLLSLFRNLKGPPRPRSGQLRRPSGMWPSGLSMHLEQGSMHVAFIHDKTLQIIIKKTFAMQTCTVQVCIAEYTLNANANQQRQ